MADTRTKDELRAELDKVTAERDRLADRYRKVAAAHDQRVGRVTELEEALRHTVEYVGLSTLQPEPGWAWYDALRPCGWFEDWLEAVPPVGQAGGDAPSLDALRAMLDDWVDGHLADTNRPLAELFDQYLTRDWVSGKLGGDRPDLSDLLDQHVRAAAATEGAERLERTRQLQYEVDGLRDAREALTERLNAFADETRRLNSEVRLARAAAVQASVAAGAAMFEAQHPELAATIADYMKD